MNESLYICSASLCCCLVVCSLIKLVAPSGSTTKILNLVIGVFALCCLVSPFVTLIKSLDEYSYNVEYKMKQNELSDTYSEEVLGTTGNYINSYTQALLANAEIYVDDIRTTIGVDDKTGIYIKEVNIYVNKDSSYKTNTIVNLVESALGVKPKVSEK